MTSDEQKWYQTNRDRITSILSGLLASGQAGIFARIAAGANGDISMDEAEAITIEGAASLVHRLDVKAGLNPPRLTQTKPTPPKHKPGIVQPGQPRLVTP